MASADSAARPSDGSFEPPSHIPPDAEWLLTDGAGGYACGAVDALPRRRYHGLWIVRPSDSAQRYQAVAGLDERIVGPRGETFLMHVHWRSLASPSLPQADVEFVLRPWPRWTFHTRDGGLERSVLLQRRSPDAQARLLVRWRNLGAAPMRLVVRPLLGFCDVDHLPAADPTFDATVLARGASWGFRPNQTLPALWLSAGGVAAFVPNPTWYYDFFYAEENARGHDHIGNRWSPGTLELDFGPGGGPGDAAVVAFALGEPCEDPAAAFDLAAAAASSRATAAAAETDSLRARLELGADDFLYTSVGGRPGILAGFPWFGEWGRDVFVSLPGLTLARGKLDACAEVLTGALPFLRRGLLPNIYGRAIEDSNYGSCDAALWFALGVQRYFAAGGDATLVQAKLLPALTEIADAYFAGTELGLAVDESGLLLAGREDLNATWMDAQVRGVPMTPRQGQPVEIQALWYSLLAFLATNGEQRFTPHRDRCGEAFVRQFWLVDGAYLADRVQAGVADRTVRPNMVIAAALPLSPLSVVQRAGVVKKARAELVTPRGLRTLSPRDPAYQKRYEGGPDARDAAYHQGTAWPWLGGFYVEASLRAASKRRQAAERTELRSWLDGFLPELDRAGLDHISEVFDGDAPQRPGGTFAQAWNTGELLRAIALVQGAAV
ncbi:MAG: amylo-alpha-1,6-glucosidase [Planctomycetota bacterium]